MGIYNLQLTIYNLGRERASGTGWKEVHLAVCQMNLGYSAQSAPNF